MSDFSSDDSDFSSDEESPIAKSTLLEKLRKKSTGKRKSILLEKLRAKSRVKAKRKTKRKPTKKPCKSYQVRDEKTGRCRNPVCDEDQTWDRTNKICRAKKETKRRKKSVEKKSKAPTKHTKDDLIKILVNTLKKLKKDELESVVKSICKFC